MDIYGANTKQLACKSVNELNMYCTEYGADRQK